MPSWRRRSRSSTRSRTCARRSAPTSPRAPAAGPSPTVAAYDPVAEGRARELLPAVELCDSAAAALDGADAAILVTEWPEFADADWAELAGRMSTPLLVDGRNFLDPGALRAAGFTYEGI